jgi:formate dehydrogenase subunit delta
LAAELAHSDGLAEAHEMQPARVARLANDIAAQFPHQPDAQAAAAIAAHIRMFWEPRMLAELTALSSRPDSGLAERARAAAKLLAGQP